MNFVVNEWLPEYFLRSATQKEQQSLARFLNTFMQRQDTIYVQVGGSFEVKIYKHAKENQQYPVYQNIKKFIVNILKDSQRCTLIRQKPELPQKIANLLAVGNFPSDLYLFETAYFLPENEPKIIVTTDTRLEKQMQNNGYFEVILLENFLEKYYS